MPTPPEPIAESVFRHFVHDSYVAEGSYKLSLELKRRIEAEEQAIIQRRIQAGARILVPEGSPIMDGAQSILERTGFTIVLDEHVPEGQAVVFDPCKLTPLDFPDWEGDIIEHRSWADPPWAPGPAA